ncbi:MAG: 16S rRNA (adenine(1518)-N(6)/adenine(1519)-N(6))-dimethyltransferase RsmA [Rhodospirillales bacterium]|nr:MAG: 16S rRNA (adenine(1518)-N(6)/adenine(1519)-N(6))-dimethyltransferase RsmA [Rhodospirillales bacterium]
MSVATRVAALPPPPETLARPGLAARRSLGQHFLLDLNLTDRIARAAGDLSAGTTIEIGPGPGGLTRSLLRAGATRVVAVERDRRAVEALAELVAAADGRLELLDADALTVDVAAFAPAPRRIVANLPYNVSTALLLRWLDAADALESMTLMFQKEVVDRLVAAPRTPAYGRLSVVTQLVCEATRLFDIAPGAFTPPPKVVSTVVRLVPRGGARVDDDGRPFTLASLARVTAAAFGQRRKMLRASLKAVFPDVEGTLGGLGIAATSRAEELSPRQFAALAARLPPGGGAQPT